MYFSSNVVPRMLWRSEVLLYLLNLLVYAFALVALVSGRFRLGFKHLGLYSLIRSNYTDVAHECRRCVLASFTLVTIDAF
jgi:hypothetical protein